MKTNKNPLGHNYHPIDMATGHPLSAEEVEKRLVGHFDALDQVAVEAGLSAAALIVSMSALTCLFEKKDSFHFLCVPGTDGDGVFCLGRGGISR